MNQGYIKLYRKSIDSQVFQNPHLWKLWTLCLMKANHKEAWVSVDHIIEPIKILPGQFITGRYSLHKEYYPKATKKQKSALTVWRWLLFLEKVGNLSIKTNNKYSIVTIINWETYQGDKKQNEQVNEQQMNNKRTTDEQQMNTNKNVKNDKKEDIILPEWLDKKTWEEFKKMRISIKKKMTPYAEELMIKKLDKLRQTGNPPIEVLERSIEGGWQGIFELGGNNGTGKQYDRKDKNWNDREMDAETERLNQQFRTHQAKKAAGNTP